MRTTKQVAVVTCDHCNKEITGTTYLDVCGSVQTSDGVVLVENDGYDPETRNYCFRCFLSLIKDGMEEALSPFVDVNSGSTVN